MKKIMLTALAAISALFLLTACPNAAGGSTASIGSTGSGSETASEDIGYLGQLIGTWQTPGFDEDNYVDVLIDVDHPPVTYKFKEKRTFTRTKMFIEGTRKDSSDPANWQNKFYKIELEISTVTATHVYFKGTHYHFRYEIIDGKLRLNNDDYSVFEKK